MLGIVVENRRPQGKTYANARGQQTQQGNDQGWESNPDHRQTMNFCVAMMFRTADILTCSM